MKQLEIVDLARFAVGDICEAEVNPNVMEPEQYGMLVEAIRKVGFLQPLLVRRTNGTVTCIDGHHRLRAAREVGLKTVPCVTVDAGDDQVTALRLGMNRLRGELNLALVAKDIFALVETGWLRRDHGASGRLFRTIRPGLVVLDRKVRDA